MPYEALGELPNIVVDGYPNAHTVLTLSHWPHAGSPAWTQADSSAEMVFRYLDHPERHHPGVDVVSNNHVDQDGLVSVFALIAPQEALDRRARLVDLARAGDFGTFSSRDAARAAIAIDHWPGATYEELLERVTELVDHVERFRDLWADEDAALTAGLEALAAGTVTIEERQELDLAIVRGPRVHPMAIHTATPWARVLYLDGPRYELNYRYESWVQYESRRPMARVDLAPLADELDRLEGSPRWRAGKVGELTPSLRVNPESTIAPAQLVERVVRHLATAAPAWNQYDQPA